jgi:hypothetical protein
MDRFPACSHSGIMRCDPPATEAPAPQPEVGLAARLAGLERRVHRRERSLRIAALVPLVGAVLMVPVLAWTASVPNPEFTAGEVISSSRINENFAALVEQLGAVEAQAHGGIVFSEGSGTFETESDTPVPLTNNQVVLETHGGAVRLELAGVPGTSSRLYVIGSGGGVDPWLFAYIGFERSSDGEAWEPIGTVDFGGIPNAAGSTALPPSAFAMFDTPVPGSWSYRVVVRDYENAGTSMVRVQNVRLVAREIGAAP